MCVDLGIILFHPVYTRNQIDHEGHGVFLAGDKKNLLFSDVIHNCECNILCDNCDNLNVVILWKHPVRR
jgi:hypothetical protein